ncbi:MAG: hypothetical protein EAX95_07135 [Candidatus Thorarchaeota archaeon]|nr:hypothetical protein [Candidatus Thorarchaeota archaeon]
MGVKNWANLVPWKWMQCSEISPGAIAIDIPNYLTRRVTVLKAPTDSEGRVPLQHIGMGIALAKSCLKAHVLPIMIFDGPPEKRKRSPNPELVNSADQLYKRFSVEGDPFDEELSGMLWQSPALRMYFSAAHLRAMFSLMGVPAITAPTEAEMFAAVLCRNDIVRSVVSNDSDALLFGSPHVTKQLHFSKGLINRVTLTDLEIVSGLNLEQLRDLAILCGCDFHKAGVKGIGPRKGAILLEQYLSLEPVLKSLGLGAEEREDLMVARESFDEANYLSTGGIRLNLNPPLIPSLLRFLEPVFGVSYAEKQVEALVGLWRKFGSHQATLEQWL